MAVKALENLPFPAPLPRDSKEGVYAAGGGPGIIYTASAILEKDTGIVGDNGVHDKKREDFLNYVQMSISVVYILDAHISPLFAEKRSNPICFQWAEIELILNIAAAGGTPVALK